MKFLLYLSVALFFLACNSKENSDKVKPQIETYHIVNIKMMAFDPDTLTVNIGDTIEWINKDIVEHDISHFPNRDWHSDTLNTDSKFSKVVSDSFSYFCSIHPTMTGKVFLQKK